MLVIFRHFCYIIVDVIISVMRVQSRRHVDLQYIQSYVICFKNNNSIMAPRGTENNAVGVFQILYYEIR